MKINFNGHFGKYQDFYKEKLDAELKFWELIKEAGAKREVRIPYDLKTCPECGAKLTWKKTKNKLEVTTKCKYPGGYPEIIFTINIPSGKMVAGNDFRGLFQVIGDHYVNHTIGIVRTVEDYAKINLAHAFVGNTCPRIFKVNDSTFVIGDTGGGKKNPVPKSRCVGSICTDLWWYSIADYDDYIKRGGKIDNYVDVIKCKPGIYQFIHRYHLTDRDDYKNPQIYTKIKWLKPPVKLVDHQAEFMKLNFTAEQVMHSLFRNSPDFYGNPNKKMISDSYADGVSDSQAKTTGVTKEEWPYYFTAESMLCGYGNGFEWHPNGWGTQGFTPKKNEPEVKIPIFNKPYTWGQPCQYSALSEMVKEHQLGGEATANPSFVRLGFNILQCILKHGVYEYEDMSQKVLKKDGPTSKWAKELYPLMVAKYGEPKFDN